MLIRKPVFIDEDDTLLEAFRLLYDPPFSVLVVVNKRHQIIGILSEGDMRRHILRGYPLDSKAKACMQKYPVIMRYSDLANEEAINSIIHRIMRKTGEEIWEQAVIPIVHGNQEVLGMISPAALEKLRDREIPQMAALKGGDLQRILVVGGGGYIGSVLSTFLVEHGYRVRVLDKLIYNNTSLNHLSEKQCELLVGDAKDIDTLVESLDGVDAVVYLAEIVGDQACQAMPKNALKTNYLALACIARLCSYLQIKRFVYTSSCSVYGASRDPVTVLTEQSPTNPISFYARIKLMSEEALLSMPSHTFSPTILRLATVFGKSYRPRFDLVVNTFAAQASIDKKIRVFGGEQFRPNVHVLDVARVIMKMLQAPLEKVGREIFNVGSAENNFTILELAKTTQELFPGTEIEIIENLTDPRNYRIDSSKLANAIEYSQYKTVREGLEEMKTFFDEWDIRDYQHSCFNNLSMANDPNARVKLGS